MNHDFPHTGPIAAELRMAAGTLTVAASERDSITVLVDALDGSESSQQAAQETRVDFKDGHLLVSTPEHGGWRLFRRARVRIQVQLPPDGTLTVRLASADAVIEGRYRDVVVHTASGDVSVEHVAGDTSITAASGDIRLGRVEGLLRINSASGDVRAGHVTGAVTVRTASGDVEVAAVDGDAHVNTASGDVTLGSARSGEIKVHTASGDVSVGVVAGTGVWLDLTTLSGRTVSDLAVSAGTPVVPTGAALSIKARTVSGDITLRRVTVPVS